MDPIRRLRLQARVTQAELARAAGTSQPAIATYEAGRKSPTLRTVERLAAAVGLELAVEFVVPLTREDRRSLMLHEAIATHLSAAPDVVLARARRNLARMAALHPDARPLLSQWRRALRQPIADIVDVLLDPRPPARELRQVTPFAGVLSPRERVDVLTRFRAAEKAA